MQEAHLYIKNMVCNRCIRVVREELEKLGLEVTNITLGEADIAAPEGEIDLPAIKHSLEASGFELLEDKKAKIVERIKTLIIDLIYSDSLEGMNVNISDYLSGAIGREYTYLSSLFSSLESVTIERYVILQKIERVKELLIYDELTLSEIAYRLGYSSVAHLSNQFRQVTGFTPSAFKKLKKQGRVGLDEV